MAGRGFGKTRSGAEFVRREVEADRAGYIALVGKTPADVRDVMIEGESGLLHICPPWNMPRYEPSKRRLTWPNGAIATTFSSYEPDQLRGPQHDCSWEDEKRSFAYAQDVEDNLLMGLRLGIHPRRVITTTPLPTSVIRDIIKNPTTVITRGSTYDNRAYLAENFFAQVVSKYANTRLGRQEIDAEMLDDVPGALWKRKDIVYKPAPDLSRVVVAIDPAVTSGESSDETGIVAAGLGIDGRGHVLADRSCRLSPDGWARRAVKCYEDFKADYIIAEDNNGGEMVEFTIKTIAPGIKVKRIHASRGKHTRAEPVSALYEQGKIDHTQPFPELEDQLTTWTPESDKSPDRLDALVWAITELMLQSKRWLPV
jgi:phage terminase large subunit-like protein